MLLLHVYGFSNFSEKLRETTFSVVWNNSEHDHTEMIKLYENYILIFLGNEYMDLNLQLVSKLRPIISHIESIKSIDTCIEYLSTLNKDNQQIFLIIYGIFPKNDLDELLEEILEFDGYVYFWCSKNEININHNIRGSFIDQEELTKAIVKDFQNMKGNQFILNHQEI